MYMCTRFQTALLITGAANTPASMTKQTIGARVTLASKRVSKTLQDVKVKLTKFHQ
jgi:hypothetical protein